MLYPNGRASLGVAQWKETVALRRAVLCFVHRCAENKPVETRLQEAFWPNNVIRKQPRFGDMNKSIVL
jgi:hypothetical protein